MQITGTLIEQMMAERYIHDYIIGSPSAAGAADGSTVVCTTFDVLARVGANWTGYYIEITDCNTSALIGQVRPVTGVSVTAGTATITVSPAFSAQVVASGGAPAVVTDFRIHRFPPTMKLQAINNAITTIGDIIPHRISETFPAGQLLKNGGFDLFGGTQTYYTGTGTRPYDWASFSSDLHQVEAYNSKVGRSSIYINGDYLTVSGGIYQTIPTWLVRQMVGVPLTLTGSMYDGKTAEGEIGIYVGMVDHDVHAYGLPGSVDGAWVTLTVSVTIANADVYVVAYSHGHVSDKYYYLDSMLLRRTDGVPTNIIPISNAFRKVDSILIGGVADTNYATSAISSDNLTTLRPPATIRDGYAILDQSIPAGMTVTVFGQGTRTRLSALTDEVNTVALSNNDYVDSAIGDDQLYLFACQAAINLCATGISIDFLGMKDHWSQMRKELQEELNRLKVMLPRPQEARLLPFPSVRWG